MDYMESIIIQAVKNIAHVECYVESRLCWRSLDYVRGPFSTHCRDRNRDPEGVTLSTLGRLHDSNANIAAVIHRLEMKHYKKN